MMQDAAIRRAGGCAVAEANGAARSRGPRDGRRREARAGGGLSVGEAATNRLRSVRGLGLPLFAAALFSAPIAAGWLYDEAQSYQPALVILTITTILAALPAMLVPTTPRAERPR